MKYVEGSKLEVDSGIEQREDLERSYLGTPSKTWSRRNQKVLVRFDFVE